MKGNQIYDLIGKFLAGEISEKEKVKFQTWLNESERNTQEFELHKDVWKKTQLNFKSSDSESVFKNLLNKIDEQHELEIAENQGSIVRNVKHRFLSFTKIAASIILLATIGYFFITIDSEPPEVVIKTLLKQNIAGQKLKFFLPDGSEVWLNAESKILFPEKFSNSKREVILEGEAFFDVIKNPDQPFIVKAGEVSTTVLGTSFNVKAFNNESTTYIVLQSGKVKVEINDDHGKQEMFLKPGEAIRYDRSKRKAVKEEFDEVLLLGWKDGIIKFKDADLEEIVSTLSRWYGVQFDIKNKKNETWSYQGTFENDNLENVLNGISFTQDFSYEFDQKNVTIYLK